MQVAIPIEMIIQTILTGIIGWIVKASLDKLKEYQNESKQWRDQIDDKLDTISNATKADMRINIVYSCEKCLRRGWITSEEMSSIMNLYERYTELIGSNGFVSEYLERIERLDIKEL